MFLCFIYKFLKGFYYKNIFVALSYTVHLQFIMLHITV